MRVKAFDGLYQSLCIKVGKKGIYKLVKSRERKIRNVDQVKYTNNEEGKVLVMEQDIKKRWKGYFHMLFNEGHEILLYSDGLDTKDEDPNYISYRRIRELEVKEAVKRMVEQLDWIIYLLRYKRV